MLSGCPFAAVIIVNTVSCGIWHLVSFLICIGMNEEALSPRRRMFRPRTWERDGRFYSSVLRINRWKDLLPQHVGKNGFSKEHLDDVSAEYLDEFIAETCRGEWNHRMNSLCVIPVLIINRLPAGLIISLLVLLGNLPFVFIQRYNRLRLQRLKKLISKKESRRSERLGEQ